MGLRTHPGDADLLTGLGYTREARQEYYWALQAFSRALEVDPEMREARIGLGQALLRLGRADEARETFQVARCGVEGANGAEVMVQIGRAFGGHGLLQDAADAFTAALALSEDCVEAAAGLGWILIECGERDRAQAVLEHAIRIEPKLYEAHVYLGHLAFDRRDWGLAFDHYATVPPAEHWDPVAVERVIRLLEGWFQADPDDLAPWQEQLSALLPEPDETDRLLAEIEARAAEGALQAALAPPDQRAQGGG